MFIQKILGRVYITKDEAVILSKSKQTRQVQIYSVNGIRGIKNFLRISKDSPEGNYMEFDLKNLYSIHRKLQSEGKATFVFRESKGHQMPKGTYQSTLQLTDLEEIFEITNVFMYQCQPYNLRMFLDYTIDYLKHYKLAAVQKNQKPKKLELKKDQLLSKKDFNNQLVQKRGRIQLKKKKLKDVFENGNFLISKKSQNFSLEKLKIKQKWVFLILGNLISQFLTQSEKKHLSKVCKNITKRLDSQKFLYIISNKNPPLFLIKGILSRFQNLRKIKFSRNSNLKFPKDFFFNLRLGNLRILDISKCGGFNEKFVNSFLNICPNLTTLKMAQKNLQYSNILYLQKLNNDLEVFKLKRNNYSSKYPESKQQEKFLIFYFKENPKLRKFQIHNIKSILFTELQNLKINLTKLEYLKIDELILYQQNFKAFCHFLKNCKNLKTLIITKIYNSEFNPFQFDQNQLQLFLECFENLTNLKIFYFGEWIHEDILEQILSNFKDNKIMLNKIKITNIEALDSYIEKILTSQTQLEHLEIQKCEKINGQCLKLLNKNFTQLRHIKVKFDDFRIKFLQSQLEKFEINDCKIIRIIQLIYNDQLLLRIGGYLNYF